MENFNVGDKVRINEGEIRGKWLEKFKERHPREDGIHEVTAKMGTNLYVLDADDYPVLFVGSWLRKAGKRSPKFKVGDMVRVLLVEGVTKDPDRVYIAEERETISKARIRELLDNIGQMNGLKIRRRW